MNDLSIQNPHVAPMPTPGVQPMAQPTFCPPPPSPPNPFAPTPAAPSPAVTPVVMPR